MNSPDLSVSADLPSESRNRVVLVVYTAAIFVSALLLFSVQPLFTKMVLPRLGGSPAVWSVAMVFFQSLLLAGCAYAHYLMKARNRIVPVCVHLLLLVAAMLTLTLSIRAGWGEPPSSGYAYWLLGLFAVSIGLPFFALAANNPLLQAWFVRTGHPNGPDPYFLYASSNIGSFLALLSYPVLLEPMFTLRIQNLIWTGGYGLLSLLIAGCGALLLQSPPDAAALNMPDDDADAPAPSWLLRARWIFLAAVPSGLLIAVTAHISTDVAAAPLLWVLPLSLYLLTWVLVFQSRRLLPHKWMLLAQPLAIAGVVVLLAVGGEQNLLLTLGGHQLCFFVIAMACHGELARTRPAAKYLTGFYVALSFGGMVGGLFAGLIAPFTFSWVAEYPILLALAALCRPPGGERLPRWSAWYWPFLAVLAVALIAPAWSTGKMFNWFEDHRVWVIGAVGVLAALLALALNANRWKIFATVVVALVLLRAYPSDDGRVETVRSFFGVHKIVVTPNGQYHVLMHGTTIHGAEKFKNDDGTPVTGQPEPITYYQKDGGIGQAITEIRERKGETLRVG